MALDDYIEPEIAIAVAVTAAVASPPVPGCCATDWFTGWPAP